MGAPLEKDLDNADGHENYVPDFRETISLHPVSYIVKAFRI